MRGQRRRWCRLSILGSLIAAQSGLASQNAYEILLRVSNTYRLLSSYHFTCQTTVDMIGDRVSSKTSTALTLAGVKPNRIRVEVKDPALNMVLVSDGDAMWTYVPQFEEYTRSAPVPIGNGALESLPSANPAISLLKSHFDRYENILTQCCQPPSLETTL